jgi:hypothetical protein
VADFRCPLANPKCPDWKRPSHGSVERLAEFDDRQCRYVLIHVPQMFSRRRVPGVTHAGCREGSERDMRVGVLTVLIVRKRSSNLRSISLFAHVTPIRFELFVAQYPVDM